MSAQQPKHHFREATQMVAKPSPALTTEEIEAALGHEPLDYGQGFFAGVRWAEQQHGITE